MAIALVGSLGAVSTGSSGGTGTPAYGQTPTANNLLILREPYLCQQCHTTHAIVSTTTTESKQAYYTRCTDCHSQIHGSDLPSASGQGRLIQ